MNRKAVVVIAAAMMVLVACAPDDDNAACSVELDQEQNEVATEVVEDLDETLGEIRVALEDGVSRPDRRRVGAAVRRLQRARNDLDHVFSQGCA